MRQSGSWFTIPANLAGLDERNPSLDADGNPHTTGGAPEASEQEDNTTGVTAELDSSDAGSADADFKVQGLHKLREEVSVNSHERAVTRMRL